MTRSVVTGNQAAGHALVTAGEANRSARGCCGGGYPITPQTEIIESVMGARFSKGNIVAVESEHSAMAVCIGAALAGARSFTASSSNGLLYMVENVFAAGLARLPIVMVVSNRTLGPPWNIWADHGDSLALRDAPWLQLYCDTHQDLVDTILLAFRVAEDPRILLPAMVTQDGFLLSHTSMVVDLPPQDLVDEYLPPLDLALRARADRPRTFGQMMSPRVTQRHREEIQAAMERVPEVLAEAGDEFEHVFGRRPRSAFEAEHTTDAETVLIGSGTTVSTLRHVVQTRRAAGEKVGFVQLKLFRPFLRDEIARAIGSAKRVAVLDRDHSPGSGGIMWNEIATSLRKRPDVLLQGYIVGLAGGEIDPPLIERVLDDVNCRERAEAPIFFPQEVTPS
jgi:pyruvate/2-oxoacid:ferredoxin oxidoreductase alpha subunit